MSKATSHTLKWLREAGIPHGLVERRTPPRPGAPYGLSHDLFGIIDIIALDPCVATWGIQSTTSGQVPAHLRKLLTEKFIQSRDWIAAGNRLFIYGWRKVKWKTKKGKWSTAKRWEPREIEIILRDGILHAIESGKEIAQTE